MASRGGGIGGIATFIGIGPFDPRDGINCDDDGGHGGAMATKYWTAFDVGGSDARVARGEGDPGRTPVPALLPGAHGIRGADRPPAVADKDTHTGVLQRHHETAFATILGVLSGRGGSRGRSADRIVIPASAGDCESAVLVRQPPILPRSCGSGLVHARAFLLHGGSGGDGERGGGGFGRPVAMRGGRPRTRGGWASR